MNVSSTSAQGPKPSASGQPQTSRLSRTQCHTCRLRRLRCDGNEPSCNKCAVRGVECLGYGERPIRWVRPQSFGLPPPEGATIAEQHHGHGCAAGLTAAGAQRSKRGRPKLVLMSHDDQRDHARHSELQLQRAVQRQRRMPCPGASLDPVEYQNHRRVLLALDYFNTDICPDLVLVDTAANPFRVPLQDWRSVPELIVNLIVSSSFMFQIIKGHISQLRYESTRALKGGFSGIHKRHMSSLCNPMVSVALGYHRRALLDLQKLLDDPSTRFGDLALSAIILLTRVEYQQSAFGAVSSHLAAGRAIIARRGGFSQLATKANYHTLTGFMSADILRTIMTPANLMVGPEVLSQLEYISHLDVIFCDGKESDFPCPSLLFEAIIRINVARMWSREPTMNVEELDAEASRVLMSIVLFDTRAWTRSHLERIFSPARSERAAAHEVVQDMCEDMASAFKHGVMLYCLRTLFVDRRRWRCRRPGSMAPQALVPVCHGSSMDAEAARKWALSRTLQALRRIWAREKSDSLDVTWCGTLVVMPLFLAGMETCPSGPAAAEDRDFVTTSLSNISFQLGDLGNLNAMSLLQVFWHETAHAPGSSLTGQQMSWDDRLNLPGAQGLFNIREERC